MAEAGVPAGPVTFTDDPFDTFYSSFESQGKIPPAMLVTTSKPSLQRSQQLFADAHIWARQLRLTSRRLQKRDFKITELNPDEQALCRKLFHCAVHNFDPVEYEQPRLALQFDFTKPCLAMRESTSKTALERLDSVPHCFKDNLHAFHTHTHTKDLMMSKGIRSLLAAMTVIAGTATLAVASITPVSAVPTISTGVFTIPGTPFAIYRVYCYAVFSAAVKNDDPTMYYTLSWNASINENGAQVYNTTGAISIMRGTSRSDSAKMSVTWVANREYDHLALIRTMSNAYLDSQSASYVSGPNFSVYP